MCWNLSSWGPKSVKCAASRGRNLPNYVEPRSEICQNVSCREPQSVELGIKICWNLPNQGPKCAEVCRGGDKNNFSWGPTSAKMFWAGERYRLKYVKPGAEICRNNAWLILALHTANERRRYKVTPSLIDWVQTQNQPCIDMLYQTD